MLRNPVNLNAERPLYLTYCQGKRPKPLNMLQSQWTLPVSLLSWISNRKQRKRGWIRRRWEFASCSAAGILPGKSAGVWRVRKRGWAEESLLWWWGRCEAGRQCDELRKDTIPHRLFYAFAQRCWKWPVRSCQIKYSSFLLMKSITGTLSVAAHVHHCTWAATARVRTIVIFFENRLKVSSRKEFSQPCSSFDPRAARSGPSQTQSASSLTRLWVLLINLKRLRWARLVGRLIAWTSFIRSSESSIHQAFRKSCTAHVNMMSYHTVQALCVVFLQVPFV